jgi:tetratricopeptide (TPR) repeat protein
MELPEFQRRASALLTDSEIQGIISQCGVGTYVLKSIIVSFKAVKSLIEDRFYHIASAMYENEEYDEVIEYCQVHLSKKPKAAYGYWFLAKAYYQKQEFDKAIDNFEKAVEINPSWDEEWVEPYSKKIKEARQLTANHANSADA